MSDPVVPKVLLGIKVACFCLWEWEGSSVIATVMLLLGEFFFPYLGVAMGLRSMQPPMHHFLKLHNVEIKEKTHFLFGDKNWK